MGSQKINQILMKHFAWTNIKTIYESSETEELKNELEILQILGLVYHEPRENFYSPDLWRLNVKGQDILKVCRKGIAELTLSTLTKGAYQLFQDYYYEGNSAFSVLDEGDPDLQELLVADLIDEELEEDWDNIYYFYVAGCVGEIAKEIIQERDSKKRVRI